MKHLAIVAAIIGAGCSSTNYQIARFDGAQAAPGEIEQAKEVCRGQANHKLQTANVAPIWADSYFDQFYRSCMAERGFKLTEGK